MAVSRPTVANVLNFAMTGTGNAMDGNSATFAFRADSTLGYKQTPSSSQAPTLVLSSFSPDLPVSGFTSRTIRILAEINYQSNGGLTNSGGFSLQAGFTSDGTTPPGSLTQYDFFLGDRLSGAVVKDISITVPTTVLSLSGLVVRVIGWLGPPAGGSGSGDIATFKIYEVFVDGLESPTGDAFGLD